METLLRLFRQWLGLLSLRTQLLMVAIGLSLVALLIIVPLSLATHQRQTERCRKGSQPTLYCCECLYRLCSEDTTTKCTDP